MSPHPLHRRRTLVVAVIAVAMLTLGALLLRVGRPAPTDDRPQAVDIESETLAAAPEQARPGPTGERAGMPAGFSEGESGAVAAAVAYTAASQDWLYLTDEQVAAAIGGIATPNGRDRLVEENLGEVRLARESLAESSGRIWWLVRPLAWRVERCIPSDCRVTVWTVTVLSAAGVAVPQAEWATVTLDLAWVGGDWRVDALRDASGPTPMTGPHDDPWDAVPFDEALGGFTRLGGEWAR